MRANNRRRSNEGAVYAIGIFLLILVVASLMLAFLLPVQTAISAWYLSSGSGTDADTMQFFDAVFVLMPIIALFGGVIWAYNRSQREKGYEPEY